MLQLNISWLESFNFSRILISSNLNNSFMVILIDFYPFGYLLIKYGKILHHRKKVFIVNHAKV